MGKGHLKCKDLQILYPAGHAERPGAQKSQ